jgi:hypothetical protein
MKKNHDRFSRSFGYCTGHLPQAKPTSHSPRKSEKVTFLHVFSKIMSNPVRSPEGNEEKTVVSAVITSQKRKIRLEFPDTRAYTALPQGNRTANSNKPLQNVVHIDPAHRPFTHEGMAPVPPSGRPKTTSKSHRTVSLRHVSLSLEDDHAVHRPLAHHGEQIKFKNLENSEETKGSTSSIAMDDSKPVSRVPSITCDDSFETSATKKQKTGWSRIDPEYLVPTFIKPSTASLSSSVRVGTTEASFRPSTQYPSLSYRLRANVSIEPYNSKKISFPQVKAKKGTNNNYISNSNRHQQQLSGESATSVLLSGRSVVDNLKIESSYVFRKKDHKYSKASLDSSDVMSMELDSILQYLINKNNEVSNTVKAHQEEDEGQSEGRNSNAFLHVTCRHNIDKKAKFNFYDIIALDKPGYPTSGYVWTREAARYVVNNHVLPKSKVFQISLNGLLFNESSEGEEGSNGGGGSGGGNTSDIIPLKQFLIEREQISFLHTGRFFGLFKELKAFYGWKCYTRHTYVNRIKKSLLFHSYFSDVELINAILMIGKITYEIESETELFCFHGKGMICISDWIQLQLKHIETIKITLRKKVEIIINHIQTQYNSFMSSDKLKKLLQEIKEHHPMKDLIDETNNLFKLSPNPHVRPSSRAPVTAGRPLSSSALVRPVATTVTSALSIPLPSSIVSDEGPAPVSAGLPNNTLEGIPPSGQKVDDFEEEHAAQLKAASDIDWIKLRSMTRISETFKNKMKGILYMAQYRIEYCIAIILEKFWLRLKLFIHGIRQLPSVTVAHSSTAVAVITHHPQHSTRNVVKGKDEAPPSASTGKEKKSDNANLSSGKKEKDLKVPGFWELDRSLFDDNGNLKINPNRKVWKNWDNSNVVEELQEDNENDDADEEGNCFAKPTTREWERQGSHLGINVNLFINNRMIEAVDFIHLSQLEKIKVKIHPTKPDLMNDIHAMCGSLGMCCVFFLFCF